MHTPPPLVLMDSVGPALGAVVFVLIMSLVREPTRRTLNALVVAGACGAYLNGGFGLWELPFPLFAIPVAIVPIALLVAPAFTPRFTCHIEFPWGARPVVVPG